MGHIALSNSAPDEVRRSGKLVQLASSPCPVVMKDNRSGRTKTVSRRITTTTETIVR